jgi:GT2 family glycosyltransferase
MSKTCQVFILYWASEKHPWPTQFTLEAVKSIKELTDVPYELVVVDNYSDPNCFEELKSKLPSDVKIVQNDRSSRCINSGRNKVWRMVEADYFALLHTDVRVSRGWLGNMLTELMSAEEKYGKPCVISPLYMPYFVSDNKTYQRFSQHFTVDTLEKLEAYCSSSGVGFQNGNVVCQPSGFYTDDGHQLMIFLASKSFRDKVGEWDEQYTGSGYDDCDMGITAILKGCKNLQSQTVYIQHLQGASIGVGQLQGSGVNQQRFIEKWGKQWLDKMGDVWIRLHKEHP